MNRREWLRLTASASGALLLPNATGWLGAQNAAGGAQTGTARLTPGRERLLADFGWRFHLGHADDPARDFGYGASSGIFSKSGGLMSGRGASNVTAAQFDDGQWELVDLPHDWAVDLPFVDNRSVNGHGAKPLGRAYPETSIGWYRRTFQIPASDNGRRIALDFDGVFRDAIVIVNNHFVGRNLSGYSPFRFDVTDLLNYDGPNTLILRVDATEGEGWFYEGAGMYRHVWVEKTAPLHVGPWGTFVRSAVSASGRATVSVDTEVINDAETPAACHLVSTILDAGGRTVASARWATASIGRVGSPTRSRSRSRSRRRRSGRSTRRTSTGWSRRSRPPRGPRTGTRRRSAFARCTSTPTAGSF